MVNASSQRIFPGAIALTQARSVKACLPGQMEEDPVLSDYLRLDTVRSFWCLLLSRTDALLGIHAKQDTVGGFERWSQVLVVQQVFQHLYFQVCADDRIRQTLNPVHTAPTPGGLRGECARVL